MSIMSETQISAISLGKEKDEFTSDEKITITARFSLTGGLRDAFNEKNWTQAYDENDNTIKLKYGIKLAKGGIRKHELGKPVDTYRKASIFWTRNPKLVNPMKDRRIWVQVAKNFEPFIALTASLNPPVNDNLAVMVIFSSLVNSSFSLPRLIAEI